MVFRLVCSCLEDLLRLHRILERGVFIFGFVDLGENLQTAQETKTEKQQFLSAKTKNTESKVSLRFLVFSAMMAVFRIFCLMHFRVFLVLPSKLYIAVALKLYFQGPFF